NVLDGATLSLVNVTPVALRSHPPTAKRLNEQPPAPPAQRLGPWIRQPPDGPVERNLSRTPAGLHHAGARPSSDCSRRDRRRRRSHCQPGQALLRPTLRPQPEAQAVGD